MIIPKELTAPLRQQHTQYAKEMPAILRELQQINYLPLTTTDESWLYYYNVPKGVFVKQRQTLPCIIRQAVAIYMLHQ